MAELGGRQGELHPAGLRLHVVRGDEPLVLLFQAEVVLDGGLRRAQPGPELHVPQGPALGVPDRLGQGTRGHDISVPFEEPRFRHDIAQRLHDLLVPLVRRERGAEDRRQDLLAQVRHVVGALGHVQEVMRERVEALLDLRRRRRIRAAESLPRLQVCL